MQGDLCPITNLVPLEFKLDYDGVASGETQIFLIPVVKSEDSSKLILQEENQEELQINSMNVNALGEVKIEFNKEILNLSIRRS